MFKQKHYGATRPLSHYGLMCIIQHEGAATLTEISLGLYHSPTFYYTKLF